MLSAQDWTALRRKRAKDLGRGEARIAGSISLQPHIEMRFCKQRLSGFHQKLAPRSGEPTAVLSPVNTYGDALNGSAPVAVTRTSLCTFCLTTERRTEREFPTCPVVIRLHLGAEKSITFDGAHLGASISEC